MLPDRAVEQTPSNSPVRLPIDRALHLVRQAIEGSRATIGATTLPADSSLEKAFSDLLSDLATEGNLRLRLFTQGTPAVLNPAMQERLFLIGREAILNAVRHSGAAAIEVEIQYRRHVLRMLIRDDGAGISPEGVQHADSHRGLHGMRTRAEEIRARIEIWTGKGSGTEVCVAVPLDAATPESMAAVVGKREER